MSEEEKKEPAAEEPAEAAKEPAAATEAVKEPAAATEAAKEPAADAVEQKNKKINKMSASEVDIAIKKTEQHMHGLTSAYAKSLLARKEELAAG